MNMPIESIFLTVALAGTGAYMGYMIKKQRDEIRKTIQVIELDDADFWTSLRQFRDVVPARA